MIFYHDCKLVQSYTVTTYYHRYYLKSAVNMTIILLIQSLIRFKNNKKIISLFESAIVKLYQKQY